MPTDNACKSKKKLDASMKDAYESGDGVAVAVAKNTEKSQVWVFYARCVANPEVNTNKQKKRKHVI